MSRLATPNASSEPAASTTTGTVTAIHRQGSSWRLVTVEHNVGAGPRLVDATTVPVGSDEDLHQHLVRMDPNLLLEVLPSGSVVCRTLMLPPMDPGVVNAALDLQAEDLLPQGLEPFRRGAATLPWKPSDNGETLAAVVGWPGQAPRDVEELEDVPMRFTPTQSCLIELLATMDQGGDASTSSMLGYADRARGTLELIVLTQGRIFVRTARVSDDAWSKNVRQVLLETAMRCDLEEAQTESWASRVAALSHRDATAFVITDEARHAGAQMFSSGSVSTDARWWSEYGLAALACVGAAGPRRSLFLLETEPPIEPDPWWVSTIGFFARAEIAATVIIVALILVFFAPLGTAYARNKMLQAKVENLQEVRQLVAERQDLRDFYAALDAKRIPITQLMRNISGQTPPEIQLTEVTLIEGQPLIMKGLVPDSESNQIDDLAGLLQSQTVFDLPLIKDRTPSGEFMQFTMEVPLARKNDRIDEPRWDWSAEPLRVMLHGEEARVMPLAYESPTGRGGTSGRLVTSRTGRGNASSNRTNSGRANTDTNAGSARDNASNPTMSGSNNSGRRSQPDADPELVKEPLTDEEIAKMTKAEALEAALIRGKLKSSPDFDEGTKARLHNEWTQLIKRWKEADS